jgi:hypothetical protein
MANQWARESINNLDDFDAEHDFFIGIVIYGDKTGTDVNQRYPLEPWMFTLAVLCRSAREDSGNWRHLGFIPSQDLVPSHQDVRSSNHGRQQQRPVASREKLQEYHNYMSVLLHDPKKVGRIMPWTWLNFAGVWAKKRLRLGVCVIAGDQKSQDNVTGRIGANGGNACRIHRGCMASAVNCTAVGPNGALHGGCVPPPTLVLKRLNQLALMDVSDGAESGPMAVVHQLLPSAPSSAVREDNLLAVAHIRCIQKLAKVVLHKVFSMHAHKSAFDDLDFGANSHGVLVATTDNHLHLFESGVILNLAEVAYGGLPPSDLYAVEALIRTKVLGCRSSVMSEYPRGTVKSNFGKLTLLSHKEKVGSVYYLLLALHDARGRELFESAHTKQKKKYQTFPTKKEAHIMNSSKKKKSKKSSSNKKRKVTSELESDSDRDMDEDDELDFLDGGAAADQPLPASAFPYRNDLLYGTDYQETYPFDQTDESIEFVCHHLRLHGFNFLLDVELDDYQLDHLMMVCWKILRPPKNKQRRCPSDKLIKTLTTHEELCDMFVVQGKNGFRATTRRSLRH